MKEKKRIELKAMNLFRQLWGIKFIISLGNGWE